MASQKILIVTLGLVVVVATLALPLSAHPSLQTDAEDHQQEETRPGMRRLTWWRWGRRNKDKKEEVTTESPTTTEVPVTDYITTTKKPSRWRSWFSRAKKKISNAAKKVKGKYERGMSVVDSVTKNGFYKAGKAIVLGVKKVGNATIKVGRKIKKGAKKIGSAVKRGYQKIRLKFSGPDEKFKILANRIKDKVESGDGRAVDLLKKLGIHITLSDQKITGSSVVNKNISVTEILQNEGMLSNKTSSSFHTALEDPEITASIDSTGINDSVISGISPAEEYDEFHSAEEYLTTEPNITDTKVEYERATTEGISPYESPISATDRNETRSTIHQDTTTEISKSTFPEKVTFLTESSSQGDMKYNVESTSSYFPTEEERISANITVTIPSTDSVSKEDSASTKTTDVSDSHLYLATISPFNESTTHSLVEKPLEETLLSFTETTTQSVNMNKTSDQTTSSTIIPTTAIDIHPPISVNTIHPLNLDISIPKNTTSKELDEYKTTTLQHSSAVSINRDISLTTEAISLSTSHDTSPLSVISPDSVTTLSEETTSFTSPITATAPTSTPTVTYASTTDPPTTSTSTLSPTTSTITATLLITSKIITNALPPTISITTTSDHLPTTLPQTLTSTTATSIPTANTIPSTTSTSTTTPLPPTISTSTTTTLPSTTSTSSTTTPPPTTFMSTTTIPPPITSTSTTLPSTTSTPTTTIPPPTTSTSTTTIPPPTTSTSITLPSTTSTSTTTTLPPTTSVATIPPTTSQPPPPTTTTSSTYPPTPAIKTHPPNFTETNKMHLPPTSPSTSIHGDSETIVEEAYVPPPFPDVFSDIEVHDRLREFYDNGDFSHAEMAELFNFDPDNYEYYKYDYNYEDYTQ